MLTDSGPRYNVVAEVWNTWNTGCDHVCSEEVRHNGMVTRLHNRAASDALIHRQCKASLPVQWLLLTANPVYTESPPMQCPLHWVTTNAMPVTLIHRNAMPVTLSRCQCNACYTGSPPMQCLLH
jgi:hypothetical protein